MTNHPNLSQTNNAINQEKGSDSEVSLGTKASLSVISSLSQNHISPKFLSPIAAKSLNSISSFPFAHSSLAEIESLGDETRPLNVLEDYSSSEGDLASSVTNIQREVETNPSINLGEIPFNNFHRQIETSPPVTIFKDR